MSSQKPDDLEAVRTIVEALKDFPQDDQQRIVRWASEKLNLSLPIVGTNQVAPATSPPAGVANTTHQQPPTPAAPGSQADIKTFMAQKKPRNDVQFAAAAAYYYRFEAALSERKDTINKEDLQEAARKASRERFADPSNTLNNAHKLGLLDKGSEKATFVINSVGENLVAMTLPDGTPAAKQPKKKAAKNLAKKAAKKLAAKKTAKKAKKV